MIAEDLLQVRTPLVNLHVLRDPAGLYLIDAGFIGADQSLQRALSARGWENEKILGIIVTHGHLDHILNVAKIARKHGAWIAAPRLDAAHYAGKPAYKGWARIGGILEAIGRPLLGFQPFIPDRWIDDGERIDIWGGLQAVHLPGHTAGHTGYFSEERGLLFCGDLFASFGRFSHLPPPVLNSDGKMIPASIGKALALSCKGILPNHADRVSPEEHLRRLRNLSDKSMRRGHFPSRIRP